MRKENVRTPEQALAYITDCTLATVCDLACKRSRPKHEFARQCSIAQIGVDWLREFKVDVSTTRASLVENVPNGVALWAQQYFPKPITKKESK